MRTALHLQGTEFPIKLEQREDRAGRFRVTYGAEVKDHLDYRDAALHLGAAILHSLACQGHINTEGL